jgi:indolepyruvate ferredoxin oxidoreductase
VTEPDGEARASTRDRALLSGVETLVRLLVVREQVDTRDGLTTATMVSGYPGSPLGGFDLVMEAQRELLDAHRILHRPGLNEELAAATVWGSQMGAAVDYAEVDGVAGAWYGKGPGLDRAGDAMKHANAMGAGPNGGVVMFCGDDPTAKSSTLTCDSQYTFEDACMPVLVPGDQQDVLDLGLHAFRMSRYSGAWVGLKIVTSVADGIGTVDLGVERHRPVEPADVVIDGRPWRHRPLATIGPHQIPDQELLVVEHRLRAAQAYARHNAIDRVIGAPPGARVGVVCAGKTFFDVVQAFADLGVGADELPGAGVRVLKLAMTYPLVTETIVELAASVDEIVVIEEKRPFVETQVRSILHEAGSPTRVLGKRDADGNPLASSVGELDPQAVAAVLTAVVPDLAPRRAAPAPIPVLAAELPGRAPGFCSGCPHNRSTVFPAGALVGGGVGCHGIMYFEARHQGMKSLAPTPMGAEGVPWIGLAPFVAEPHLIQNLGDGTLSHSGTLAIRACVAAGVDITFKILYNSAVAMTGGQDVTGLLDVPALTRALEAEAVGRIVVCADDPKRYARGARWANGVQVLDRDRLPGVQEELRGVRGVTVIVYDQRCAAEARRLRKRGELEEPPQRVFINEAVCEGCGDCTTKSNCLSVLPVDTEFGEKRMIHDLSCNRDYTCLDGDCPSFVTLTPARRGRRRARARTRAARHDRPSLPAGELPAPAVPRIDGRYGIYFTGIGGTGVVTANRILAAAAEAAGLVVDGMDQTGLSQKAGAVASHLHLAAEPDALGSAAVGSLGADLYLSGDILQAAAPFHLAKVRPGHSVAVIDRDVTPTASMLQRDAPPPGGAALQRAIEDRVGTGIVAFVDSTRIAEDILDNHLLANVVVLGAAFQLGGLPLSLADVERGIGRQGATAAANRAAFEWGRWAVHDPAAVAAALATAARAVGSSNDLFDPSARARSTATSLTATRAALPDELRELLTRRAAQVVDYQSATRATRYLDLVEQAAARDDASHDWALTRGVAEAWFKLLTYKDEYEVARLHLKVDYDRVADDLGMDGPYLVTYHLHPPVLRRLGLKHKLPLGRSYRAAFHALRGMRRVRGTPLDVFGWDRDRRLERAVIDEYEQLLTERLRAEPPVPYDALVHLAESPMAIKGYGPIKEESVARWRDEVASRRRQLEPVPATDAARA